MTEETAFYPYRSTRFSSLLFYSSLSWLSIHSIRFSKLSNNLLSSIDSS